MSKISNVFYTEIDPEVCSIQEAAQYHYHFNLLKFHEMFQKEYEDFEEMQINMRNKLIGDAIKSGEIKVQPRMNSTIFGISAHKNKAILIVET